MSRIIYFFYIAALISLSSCVPASEDSFDDISIDNIPLKTGNKWIYDITRGGESFTDSAEILDYFPYQVDELTNRYLYQYKDIAFTFEMSEFIYDTVFVKLLEYEGDELFQYGSEKRDRSGFIYGEPVIFSTPEVILDHSDNTAVEGLFISSLQIAQNGIVEILNDTIVHCIKTRSVQTSGSFITTDLNYDLYSYYTEFGILKIEGVVNSSAFSATAVSCTIK
ncbi:TPA: hypothetical protein DCR49_09445 [Candidatus Delongbacteria bacterium]|nr:hypothetical protein [Candidatus Delongbacteria bacterium]